MSATALDYYGATGDTYGGTTAFGGALPEHLPTMLGYGDGLYGERTYGGLVYDTEPRFMVQVKGGDGAWLDVTCDVRELTIDRGRSSWVEAFKAGTLTIAFANFAGVYSTFPSDSVWRQPGGFVTDVPIRIASYVGASGLEWRFTGTTDRVTDSWPGTTDALATVEATDAFKALARHNGGPRAAVGAGELTGARVNRLLDDAAFADPRAVAAGTVTLQATDLNGITLDLLRITGESEYGWLYVRGDGTLRFLQRDAMDNDPRMKAVQWTFTDDDALAGACYGDVKVASDSDRIVNLANVTPPGHSVSTFQDGPSVAWYGPRTWTRTDLPINLDVDALGLAQIVVGEGAYDDQRIDEVVIDGANRPGNFAAAHGVAIADRVRFVRTIPGGHQLDAELLVYGRRDQVVASGAGIGKAATWTITLSTGSAVNLANLGQWDDGTWDDAIWGV